MKQWLEALQKTYLAGSYGFINISSAESSSSSSAILSNVRSIVSACRFLLAPLKIRAEGLDKRRYDDDGDDDDHDGCNDNGDDDDGDDRANVEADGGDYGSDTFYQMTQLRPRTRRCN